MGDLISRKEAYRILAEYYHLNTHIQQDSLMEALSRVPDAKAFSVRDGALKQSMADYIVYRRKWLYEHLEMEFDILKGARDLAVKSEAIGDLHEKMKFPEGFFQKERPEATEEKYDQFEGVEVKMIKDDEIVVAFCNAKVAEELQLPKEAAVITELLGDNESIVVPKDEFLKWLRGEDD